MEARGLTVTAESTTPVRVLLVQYPAALARTLAAALVHAGMEVETAFGKEEVQRLLDRFRPGVLLLHTAGADASDLALLGRLVGRGDWGTLVMLAKDDEAGRIASLDGGADDVLSEQTPLGEVAARVRAVYRRVRRSADVPPIGQIMLEPAHRCLIGAKGERIPLSEAEFVVLETLLDADGAPVSREWLGRAALKRPLHAEDRSVDQLVLKLRRKLSAAGAPDRTILSARRQGYLIPDPSRFHTVMGSGGRNEVSSHFMPAQG
jgi:DNA-binding response OmpR family regulator